jgi:hypothetical protein
VFLQDAVTGVNRKTLVGRRDGREQLCVADTQFTLIQIWREMGRDVADQSNVTGHQHHGQEDYSDTCGLAHEAILDQLTRISCISLPVGAILIAILLIADKSAPTGMDTRQFYWPMRYISY